MSSGTRGGRLNEAADILRVFLAEHGEVAGPGGHLVVRRSLLGEGFEVPGHAEDLIGRKLHEDRDPLALAGIRAAQSTAPGADRAVAHLQRSGDARLAHALGDELVEQLGNGGGDGH